jgi:hypothetical protein
MVQAKEREDTAPNAFFLDKPWQMANAALIIFWP